MAKCEKTVTNVNRTCGPTHLLVFSGNKICLNYRADLYATIWTFYGHLGSGPSVPDGEIATQSN